METNHFQKKTNTRTIKRLLLSPIKALLMPPICKLQHYPAKAIKLAEHYNQALSLNYYPSISIVTPSYNQANYLNQTLKSVLDQHYPRLEYIVQDGGSQDHSLQVIESYCKSLTYWESKKDRGQAHALNLGFQKATGEIMAYLNSDDILLPGSLAYIAKFFNEHPEIDVVYGHRIIINEQGQEIGRWVLPRHDDKTMTWADFIPQETLFWRRKIWEKSGGAFDESFQFALDWDLILRFSAAGAKFSRLPRFLGGFRVHQLQKTSSNLVSIGQKEMDRLRIRCHGKKVSTLEINMHLWLYLLKQFVLNKLYISKILHY